MSPDPVHSPAWFDKVPQYEVGLSDEQVKTYKGVFGGQAHRPIHRGRVDSGPVALIDPKQRVPA